MEHVTRKELDKILNGHLSAKSCPKCGGSPQITMPLTLFGRDGIKIECRHCGYSTDLQRIHIQVADETRFATPITPKSVVKAVYNAVSVWNKAVVFRRAAQ